MKPVIYIFMLLTFSACSTKTSSTETNENEFTNEFISDSLLTKIPTISCSKFELNSSDNEHIDHKYIDVTEKQLNFFYSEKELKKLTDYFEEMHVYFYGKRKIGTDKMALYMLIDADYLGIYLDCAVVDKAGNLIGKFYPAYTYSDADYWNVVKGEFLNDSTYKYSEVNFTYIDGNHKTATQDSTIYIVTITDKEIQTKLITKFPTDTIIESDNAEKNIASN